LHEPLSCSGRGRTGGRGGVVKGTYLKFYVQEKRRLHGILAYDWILEKAKKVGIQGGSAFRAVAGFGRHGVLHEDRFFELAGDLPVEVGFAVTDDEADRFLQLVRDEKVSLFYLRLPVEFDVINAELPHVPTA
jgi:PII-like signaling protein